MLNVSHAGKRLTACIVVVMQSLYCDVRQLLTYVKEIHGGTFRKVALAALIDALKHPQTASNAAHKSTAVRSASAAAVDNHDDA